MQMNTNEAIKLLQGKLVPLQAIKGLRGVHPRSEEVKFALNIGGKYVWVFSPYTVKFSNELQYQLEQGAWRYKGASVYEPVFQEQVIDSNELESVNG